MPDPGDGGVSDGDAEPRPLADAVDLLFIVDTSCEAPLLLEELGRSAEVLLRELREPTPDPATGVRPRAVRDLHVGVTTMAADMAGSRYVNCEDPELGALVLDGWPACSGATVPADDCPEPPCSWLHDDGSTPRATPIWVDTACLVGIGGCGCGWEQPLEAMRLALTEQSAPGGANEGFLREGSVLVVVFMATEDDCSVADPTLFDPDVVGPDITTVCFLHPEMVRPVGPYVDLLRDLRPGREDRVVVAVLGGIPADGSWTPGDPVDALRDMIHVDEEDPQSLVPYCESPGGYTVPAPRLVELAYAFGDGAFVASLCQWDWSALMMDLARTVQRRLE